jgi:uncharacterized membrane protein
VASSFLFAWSIIIIIIIIIIISFYFCEQLIFKGKMDQNVRNIFWDVSIVTSLAEYHLIGALMFSSR